MNPDVFKMNDIQLSEYLSLNRKLWSIFDVKYSEFRGDNSEQNWSNYLHSLECVRRPGRGGAARLWAGFITIECPDSYHRVYKLHLIDVPEELAFRVLTLGYLP